MVDFSELNLSDAEILSIVDGDGVLRVTYKDWQENIHELLFYGVISYRCFSPEGRALSHGAVMGRDAFIDESCRLSEEEPDIEFSMFSFISAWTDKEVCTIVAKSVSER